MDWQKEKSNDIPSIKDTDKEKKLSSKQRSEQQYKTYTSSKYYTQSFPQISKKSLPLID